MKRVLVVDDHEAVVRLVSLILRTDGFAVEAASNGQEALDMIEEAEPDALVLDLVMPVMDGPTLLEKMREAGHHVPVLVLSQFKPSEFSRKLLVEGVLSKPFDPDELTSHVKRIVGER